MGFSGRSSALRSHWVNSTRRTAAKWQTRSRSSNHAPGSWPFGTRNGGEQEVGQSASLLKSEAAGRLFSSSQTPKHVLSHLRVVLVSPKGPANIGAVARACANFEVPLLTVVDPRCDALGDDVKMMACGAEDILQNMRVVPTLADALADTTGSIGLTRRAGKTRIVHDSLDNLLRDFPTAVPGLLQPDVAEGELVALVFGREESGLSEPEARRCSHTCAINTGRFQPSLNLSHAVAVMLSQIYDRRCAALQLPNMGVDYGLAVDSDFSGVQPCTNAEQEALLAKLARIATLVGISAEESRGGGAAGSHGRRRLPLGHIRAIASRARMNTWEVRSLHGLASAVLMVLERVKGQIAMREHNQAPPAAEKTDRVPEDV